MPETCKLRRLTDFTTSLYRDDSRGTWPSLLYAAARLRSSYPSFFLATCQRPRRLIEGSRNWNGNIRVSCPSTSVGRAYFKRGHAKKRRPLRIFVCSCLASARREWKPEIDVRTSPVDVEAPSCIETRLFGHSLDRLKFHFDGIPMDIGSARSDRFRSGFTTVWKMFVAGAGGFYNFSQRRIFRLKASRELDFPITAAAGNWYFNTRAYAGNFRKISRRHWLRFYCDRTL